MPRPPLVSSNVSGMPPRVFSKFANRIAQMSGEVYPLHVGDTYLKPAKGARMEDLLGSKNAGLNRYTFPHGHPELISAVSEEHGVSASRIQICSGATAGLHCIASTFLSPGDEVIILAPYWPLIGGIVQLAGATAVSVPFFGSEGTVAERIAPYLNDKTVAINGDSAAMYERDTFFVRVLNSGKMCHGL